MAIRYYSVVLLITQLAASQCDITTTESPTQSLPEVVTRTRGRIEISPVATYTAYYGNGSVAQGWPSLAKWLDFDSLYVSVPKHCLADSLRFASNAPHIKSSCSLNNVSNVSDGELQALRRSIEALAGANDIDDRFILATVMQESSGCVRSCTTSYDGSILNTGLMQSHNGLGTCNDNRCSAATFDPTMVKEPCLENDIAQMIEDGTLGTATGDGLQQLLEGQDRNDESTWYRAARMYNGGSVDASGDLEKGCCTKSYASDIANRLTG